VCRVIGPISPFLIVRLASDKSFYRPTPLILGEVEIRPAKFDSFLETQALRQSAIEFKADTNLEMAPRLATILEAPSILDACLEAVPRFEAILDILDATSPGLSEFTLTEVGYARDLRCGRVHARTPADRQEVRFLPTPSFQIVREKFSQIGFPEFLAEQQGAELVQRLLRSIHWSRKARWESNFQLKALHRWFAMEAAIKRNKDHNIVPEILLAMGFPSGHAEQALNPSLRSRLWAHPRYQSWRKEIRKRLERMRDWRNSTVHSGFRPWDFTRDELKRLNELSAIACSRVQRLLFAAIKNNLKTLEELDILAVLLLEQEENLVNDVHGNIIYGFEHP